MSEKKPNGNSASLMLNKIVVLRNYAKPIREPLFIEAACPQLATLLKIGGVLMLEGFS